jgi:hypothetical protein
MKGFAITGWIISAILLVALIYGLLLFRFFD